MLDTAQTGAPQARGALRVAGSTLVQHQLGLALALDCKRIVCLARNESTELEQLRASAEDSGLVFGQASGVLPLAAMVSAADEIIVISDGLFADPSRAAPLLAGTGACVLTLPAEPYVAAGFERLDSERAAAGLMRVPGNLVEQLHDLPDDYDLVSALMRLALQAGVAMKPVPEQVRSGVRWRLVRSEADAHEVEEAWLRGRFVADDTAAPGAALARFAVVSFGSSMLHAGNASNALSLAVLFVLGLAAGFAWFSLGAFAYVMIALAWLLVQSARMLREAERQALGETAPPIPRADVLGWTIDLAIFLVALGEIAPFPGEPLYSRIFAPAMLIVLLRVMPPGLAGRARALAADRFVLCLVLALANACGALLATIELLAAGLALCGILVARAREHG